MSQHDHEAQRLYNQLALLSDISAASLDNHINAGKPGATILALTNGEPPHLEFARRYNGCHTDRSRATVINEWQDALRAIRYSKRPTIDLGTLDGRLQVAADTRPAEQVAWTYGISERTVWRWRAEAKKRDQRAHALRNRIAA